MDQKPIPQAPPMTKDSPGPDPDITFSYSDSDSESLSELNGGSDDEEAAQVLKMIRLKIQDIRSEPKGFAQHFSNGSDLSDLEGQSGESSDVNETPGPLKRNMTTKRARYPTLRRRTRPGRRLNKRSRRLVKNSAALQSQSQTERFKKCGLLDMMGSPRRIKSWLDTCDPPNIDAAHLVEPPLDDSHLVGSPGEMPKTLYLTMAEVQFCQETLQSYPRPSPLAQGDLEDGYMTDSTIRKHPLSSSSSPSEFSRSSKRKKAKKLVKNANKVNSQPGDGGGWFSKVFPRRNSLVHPKLKDLNIVDPPPLNVLKAENAEKETPLELEYDEEIQRLSSLLNNPKRKRTTGRTIFSMQNKPLSTRKERSCFTRFLAGFSCCRNAFATARESISGWIRPAVAYPAGINRNQMMSPAGENFQIGPRRNEAAIREYIQLQREIQQGRV